MRKFEKVRLEEFTKYRNIDEYNDIILPKRATKFSSGYDFYIPYDVVILPKETKSIKTGIKVLCNEDEFLMIVIRSSIGIKRGLRLKNQVGIIDCDYYGNIDNDGHIMISLENTSNYEVVLSKGDRIAQGIFMKYFVTEDEEENDCTRIGGFGSTNTRK